MKFSFRSFTSLTLFFTFLIVLASGLIMWLVHAQGNVFGFSRMTWRNGHIYVSLAMTAAALLHLILNWKPFWRYIWNHAAKRPKHWKEFILALAVSGGIFYWTDWQARHMPNRQGGGRGGPREGMGRGEEGGQGWRGGRGPMREEPGAAPKKAADAKSSQPASAKEKSDSLATTPSGTAK